MPKIVDEAEQRQRIRDAARSVFAERGLAGTGLTHVAAEAGMRRSNLYHYYVDKDALIRDMAAELLEEEAQLFAAAEAADGHALDRIQRAMQAALAMWGGDLATCRLFIQLWAAEPDSVRPYLRRIRASLAGLVRDGQRRGEIRDGLAPDVAAAMLVALIDGLLVQACLDADDFPALTTFHASVDAAVSRLLDRA